MERILSDLRLKGESGSYINAMHAVLSHKQWVSCPKYILAGKTAMSFRFTVHRRLTAESITAYNWIAENFLAADFIGIASSQKAGFSFAATFPLYQKHAVAVIKESIDHGLGAVIWKDGFVVASGYDDRRNVLYYCDGEEDGLKELPYSEFGRNQSPYWYFQIFENKIELDEQEVFRESLVQAVFKWETHDLLLPRSEYACSGSAYDALLEALQTRNFDRSGAGQVIVSYAAAKHDIHLYTMSLARIWPSSRAVADAYSRLDRIWAEISNSVDLNKPLESDKEGKIVPLLSEAKKIEKEAVQSMKVLMRETIGNRFHDIGLR